ncbi:hypothetical protein GGF31_001421 [Allomyces arbusculus]|nr:hypothetical protein GGF31_001421 [Allomyces arbusculus]
MSDQEHATTVPGGPTWYSDAADYWKNVEPTVDGMLGGFANLDDRDAADSIAFIDPLVRDGTIDVTAAACDCGAGIGRVTKSFLSHHFTHVDLVEQDTHFINTAKQDPVLNQGLVRHFINVGLQNFDPQEHGLKYGLVWCQWVLGHLTDDDLVAFFQRVLTVCPIIGIKENMASGHAGDFEVDLQDSSVTRSERAWRRIFKAAGVKVIKEKWQTGWPKALYKVKMWLVVKDESAETESASVAVNGAAAADAASGNAATVGSPAKAKAKKAA